ncbi:MAG TPA: FtsX-like permease family protein, partial [Gemmatimonadales bacterium]|nr:FtsX-like permease family protein [Gemmatimonadales bacterium]
LYGVVAYSVARRTSELGIRMALGARGRAIVWLVLRETLGFAAAGVLIGLPLSWAANSALKSQLYGVGAHDFGVVIGSVLLLAATALVAGFIPARRAARIDPRTALSAD